MPYLGQQLSAIHWRSLPPRYHRLELCHARSSVRDAYAHDTYTGRSQAFASSARAWTPPAYFLPVQCSDDHDQHITPLLHLDGQDECGARASITLAEVVAWHRFVANVTSSVGDLTAEDVLGCGPYKYAVEHFWQTLQLTLSLLALRGVACARKRSCRR